MKTLLYIASAGYSGSTLLDMLLGMNSDVTSLGEVHLLNEFIKKDLSCTCGKKVRACEFWQSVENKFKVMTGNVNFNLEKFYLKVDEERKTVHRKLPSLAEILLIIGNRKVWKATANNLHCIRKYSQACENAIELFKVVCKVQNTSVIVDSTKKPIPLKLFYTLARDYIKILYLVRDGRGVTYSHMKNKHLTIEQATKRWVRDNWNLILMMKSIPKKKIFFLKYEDLCTKTDQILNNISMFVGEENMFKEKYLSKQEFHNINGNPMRFRRDESEIKLDEKWRSKLDNADLKVFERIGGKLNGKLGYHD